MKTSLAIIAAFAYVVALAAAEEPAVKDPATAEDAPAQRDADDEAAEYGGGGYGGGGYGGYRGWGGGYRGWGGGYRGYRGYRGCLDVVSLDARLTNCFVAYRWRLPTKPRKIMQERGNSTSSSIHVMVLVQASRERVGRQLSCRRKSSWRLKIGKYGTIVSCFEQFSTLTRGAFGIRVNRNRFAFAQYPSYSLFRCIIISISRFPLILPGRNAAVLLS
ncbi:hypothetical protein PHYPSEUDO_000575 [Phytophthora pseudosyringae]|uniref:Uncharacterized protein n=1 Tax=Phytophthora pseudosyringae TaxID=221518 RepID=A0A8T1V3Q0_9STRA|nr:hypothetical protein PHYPSEUDO_000575 [Phytophthora pseudosyringae]